MKLVIVESPAKCKKIESYLGPGYKCVASFGHITGIVNGMKDIDIPNGFKPNFSQLSKKGKYINALKKQIQKASEIILATDDDREGEAIAWHICKVFKLPLTTTKRIIFNEITKPAILNAVANPTHVNIDKVNAQQARQVLDLIVGYTVSPILWKYISRKKQLSGGRCQTPALRIIYDNDNEIKENPGKMVYETVFYYKELPFKLNHYFLKPEMVESFLNDSSKLQHMISSGSIKENVIKKPPMPLTTSILQQKASNELHYSPKRTMQIAQKLYEGGHITYMRTDSMKYSAKFLKDTSKYIKSAYGNKYLVSNVMKLSNKIKSKKGNSQEAHEAIRPTHIEKKVAGENTQQKNLYNLIRCITLESCMIPAVYKSICATINSPAKYIYRKSEEQVVEPGWKIVRGYEETNNHFKMFESIKNEKKVKYDKIDSEPNLKDRKLHMTEAKLVQTLEKKGIGRPSTFSNIISKIQERGYVKKQDVAGKKIKTIVFSLVDKNINKKEGEKEFGIERNKLVLQTTGKIVIEFLIKHFDSMFVYDYTKHMEDDLDKISKGNKTFLDLCSMCYNELMKLSNTINMNEKQVYKIDEHHCYMIGKFGPVIRKDIDGETSFINVKKDLDIEKIRNGDYTLEEMIEITNKIGHIILGKYKNNDVILKKGKFGMYINSDGKNYSIKHIKKSMEKIVLKDVLGVLKGESKNSNILLELRKNLSIRKGKYGPYIFYKIDGTIKPRFLKLKNIDWKQMDKNDIITWIENEYNI
jgi:DNA topoisomerase I